MLRTPTPLGWDRPSLQLIGTAHGQLLENLIKNPTLSDLVGGICSVTLGERAASRPADAQRPAVVCGAASALLCDPLCCCEALLWPGLGWHATLAARSCNPPGYL